MKNISPDARTVRITRYVVVLLALVVAVVSVCIYVHWLGLNEFLKHFVPDFVVICILSAGGFFLLERRGISLSHHGSMHSTVSTDYVRDFFARHDDVNWGEVISEARSLDIVTYYYDGWVRQHHDQFVTFFRSGGKLALIISDPEDVQLMSAVQRQHFPRVTPDELAKKVMATISSVQSAVNDSGIPNIHPDIRYFPRLLNYSFVLVDERRLYLSVFEQFRGPTVRSSVFTVDLTVDKQLEEYWLNNLKEFKRTSRSPRNNHSLRKIG